MNFSDLPANLQQKTDAELFEIIPNLTTKTIKVADVRKWIRDHDLFVREWSPTGNVFVGPLVEAHTAANATQKKRLVEFLGYLNDVGDPDLKTDKPGFGKKMSVMFDKLVVDRAITQNQADEFFALGGKRIWKDETEATIAAARAVRDNGQTFHEQFTYGADTYLSPAEITKDKSTVIQALRDWADYWENGTGPYAE